MGNCRSVEARPLRVRWATLAHRTIAATALATGAILGAGVTAASADPHGVPHEHHQGGPSGPPSFPGQGYDAIPAPLPGNLPSLGGEAYSFGEIGNEITLAVPPGHRSGTPDARGPDGHGPGRGPEGPRVTHVTVVMSSWACQSGSWTNGTCTTQPGATFTEPITLTLYDPPAPGSDTPGTVLGSVTQTFSIPYRPSSDPRCTGTTAGGWYDGPQGCFHGIDDTISFPLPPGLDLPQTLVYGISYNTSDHGPVPYGDATACHASTGGCPYDSLNVALSNDPTNVTVGGDPNPGTLWWDTSVASFTCDNGAAGLGTFRMDSPEPGDNCWSVSSATPPWQPPYYVPAVRFAPGPAHPQRGPR